MVAQTEYFAPVVVVAARLLSVAPPVLARLLAMAAMAQPPAFQAYLLPMPQVAVADVD
jgi:hypothetical protein